MQYETLRHFADSWGMVYLFVVFLAVVLMLMRPGAKDRAREAALIPFTTEEGNDAR